MVENEVSCGGIVFRKDIELKFLLMHKPDAKGFHGYWGFVKGNVEEGEDETDTVLRELNEETGVTEAKFIGDFKEVIHFFYKRDGKLISKVVKYYILQVRAKGIRLSKEHDDSLWLSYEEALNKLKFKNDKAALKKAYLFLNKK